MMKRFFRILLFSIVISVFLSVNIIFAQGGDEGMKSRTAVKKRNVKPNKKNTKQKRKTIAKSNPASSQQTKKRDRTNTKKDSSGSSLPDLTNWRRQFFDWVRRQ